MYTGHRRSLAKVSNDFLTGLTDEEKTWVTIYSMGAQWLSGRVLDSRPKGSGFEPHRRHCVVVLEQDTFIPDKYWFNPGRPVPI